MRLHPSTPIAAAPARSARKRIAAGRSRPATWIAPAVVLLVGLTAVDAAPLSAALQPPPAAPPAAAGGELEQALLAFQEKLGAGDLDGAIAQLESLVARPDAPDTARGILGGLYVEAGRFEEARRLLEPLAARPDADPAVLYNAGRAALGLGDDDQGVVLLERAARAAPRSPAARELGLLRGREGRYAEAYVLLFPWVNEHPDDLLAVRAAAAGAVQLERLDEAEQLLAALPQDDPGVRLLWGRVLVTKGDPWGAIQMLTPLLAETTDVLALDVRRALADSHLQVGQSKEAIAVLDGYVGNDPTLALRLAQAQYQAGDVDAALATLGPFAERVLADEAGRARVDPALVAGLSLEHGRLLLAAGRAHDALPYLELATATDDGNRIAWQSLGQALAAAGERDRAQQALERFRALDEENDQVSLNRRVEDLADPTGRALRTARELLGEGRAEEALELLRREVELKPADPRPSLLEAHALLELERAEEGLAAGERALEIAPDHPDAHYVVGTVLMALRRFDEAERRLRQTLELAPEHTAALNDLAVLLIEAGRRDEARPLLERALALNPADPVAKANLAKLVGG